MTHGPDVQRRIDARVSIEAQFLDQESRALRSSPVRLVRSVGSALEDSLIRLFVAHGHRCGSKVCRFIFAIEEGLIMAGSIANVHNDPNAQFCGCENHKSGMGCFLIADFHVSNEGEIDRERVLLTKIKWTERSAGSSLTASI
jgi:hypothetical protein